MVSFIGIQTVRGGDKNVTGDIYSGIEISNLKVGSQSVIASGGNITNVDGTSWKIKNYSIASSMLWSNVENKMQKNIARLKSESYENYTNNTITGFFNLNPKNGLYSESENSNKPEGQVWLHVGDLTIGEATFSGKGTIIVEGEVTINGDIKYSGSSSDSLGIIANTVKIESNVLNLVGAYYSFGEINIR